MKHLKNNKGSATPFMLILTVCLLALVAALYQNYIAISSIKTVHAVMEKAAFIAISKQSGNTYPSKRESNHGAYTFSPTDSDWVEDVSNVRITLIMNEMLQISNQGNTLVKYSREDNTVIYRLKNVSLEISNPNIHSTNTIKAKVSLTFEMPIQLGFAKGTISLPLSVTAENQTKY